MKGITHKVISLSLTMETCNLLHVNAEIPFYFGLLIGASLPDLDLKLGSSKKDAITEHRGITHSLIGVFSICSFLFFLNNYFKLGYSSIIYGISVGCFLHLFEDCFNPMGCPLLFPLFPINKRFCIPIIKYDGIGESILLLTAILFLIFKFKEYIPINSIITVLTNLVP